MTNHSSTADDVPVESEERERESREFLMRIPRAALFFCFDMTRCHVEATSCCGSPLKEDLQGPRPIMTRSIAAVAAFPSAVLRRSARLPRLTACPMLRWLIVVLLPVAAGLRGSTRSAAKGKIRRDGETAVVCAPDSSTSLSGRVLLGMGGWMLLHTSSRWRCRNRGAKAGAGCCHYFIPRFVVELC